MRQIAPSRRSTNAAICAGSRMSQVCAQAVAARRHKLLPNRRDGLGTSPDGQPHCAQAASSRTIAAPMPVPPPVTIATLPCSRSARNGGLPGPDLVGLRSRHWLSNPSAFRASLRPGVVGFGAAVAGLGASSVSRGTFQRRRDRSFRSAALLTRATITTLAIDLGKKPTDGDAVALTTSAIAQDTGFTADKSAM